MKFNYLFVDHNNGHETTYHPFSSNHVLSQEKVTEWLMQIPGTERMGTNVFQLLHIMFDKGLGWEYFTCPCCDKQVNKLDNPNLEMWERQSGIKWELLDGVSGNY
jgi:hypothetical protein